MLKKYLIKGVYLILSIFYSLLILGITRVVLKTPLIPTYLFLDVFLLIILFSPILIFKRDIINRIYTYIIVSFMSFLFLANTTYYEASGTMLHLGMLKFMGEAKSVFDISYLKWYLILPFIGFIVLFIFINIVLNKLVFKKKEKVNNKFYLYSLFIIVLLVTCSILSTIGIKKKIYKDNNLIAEKAQIYDGETIINFYTKYLRASSFSNFGILTFYSSNYKINYKNADCGKEIESIVDSKNENNEFHGLLSGYNVFTIMVETGISEMITEEFTPNLYALMSDGINFDNNYNKDKTSVAEIIGFTGSYPLDGINYEYDSSKEHNVYELKINTPYSITNILGDSYYKQFFHDGQGYYARNYLIGQFGFDTWKHEYYNVHSYSDPGWDFVGDYELDADYIDIVLDNMYSKDKPFYTFYTTLSTHGPYEDYSGHKEVALRDRLFETLGYSDKFDTYYESVYGVNYPDLKEKNSKFYKYLKHLTCAFMNLDEAIGKIVNRLKDEGLYDNTIFVVYGDHDAYYHQSATNPGLSRILTDSDSVDDVRQYKTVLFISNPTLKNKFKEVYNVSENKNCIVNTFTSPYIIVPTLLDLLGYNYDTQYYYSTSFFDFKTEYDGIFYSSELGAFFTDKFYSTSINDFNWYNEDIKKDIMKISEIESIKLLKLKSLNDFYKYWFYFEDE